MKGAHKRHVKEVQLVMSGYKTSENEYFLYSPLPSNFV